MLYVEPDVTDTHFYRNSQADEVVYVVEGTGVLESVFGELPYRAGDYVVGTTLVVDGGVTIGRG